VLASLLAGIGEVGCPSVIHLRGDPGQFGTALPINAWLAPGPVRLDKVLAERPVMICQGLNTLCAALAAGCPVLSLPEHLEQTGLANQITRQGLGLALSPHASPEEAGAVLRRLVEEPAFRARAEAFAARYAGYDPRLAVEAVVGECLSLLG
jgi:UDP:flavonoid glycosyltransferase YjiC (YdhE family)